MVVELLLGGRSFTDQFSQFLLVFLDVLFRDVDLLLQGLDILLERRIVDDTCLTGLVSLSLIYERLPLECSPFVVVVCPHHPQGDCEQQQRTGEEHPMHQLGTAEIIVGRRHDTEPSLYVVIDE